MTNADDKAQIWLQRISAALVPEVHSTIFWRWKKSEVKTWSEAVVGEVNGEFINVDEYPESSPKWINVNDIEWQIKQ